MYPALSTLLSQPERYARTGDAFWTDPHISQGMLAAHLDPETDAASRNHAFIERSAAWIRTLWPSGADVLDIGCGPGLYTCRFARSGWRVTGLDFSARSIAYARSQDAASRYLVQDYLQMDFESAFDLVTLIWCDYGALVPQERHTLMTRVWRALRPGGLFLLDVFTDVFWSGFSERRVWERYDHGGFWSPEPHLCLLASYRYPAHVTLDRTVVLTRTATRCYNIWNTCFTAERLLAEAGRFGFAGQAVYADVAGAPASDGSETCCVVLQKPAGSGG
mgnify:FL=1